jgi:intein/homing endonuclease
MATQIRFTVNDQMMQALQQLKTRLQFMSDAEIFKFAISRLYYEEMEMDENGFTAKDRRELEEALAETKEVVNLEGPFDNAEDFIASLKK